jgi:hypothetical protein
MVMKTLVTAGDQKEKRTALEKYAIPVNNT